MVQRIESVDPPLYGSGGIISKVITENFKQVVQEDLHLVVTDMIQIPGNGLDRIGREMVGKIRIRVTATDPSRPVFVGIARAGDVARYLAGTRYTTVRDIGSTTFTAITTPFRDDFTVDHAFLAQHVSWLVDHGVRGIVPLGSLGEGATLSAPEKLEVLATCRKATAGRVPLVAGIGTLATADAVSQAVLCPVPPP